MKKRKKSPLSALYEDFKLNEITIEGLQQKMQSGTQTARSITDLYLKRIDDIDKKGPTINHVERMFSVFHLHPLQYENRRTCYCKACVSAINLSLKIISRYAEFTE